MVDLNELKWNARQEIFGNDGEDREERKRRNKKRRGRGGQI